MIIDCSIDGFIIAFEGIVISIALVPHEFVHVLGDVVFLVNFGLGKKQAVIIRLLCQLATPITGCAVKVFQEVSRDTLEVMHTYGHGLIAGIFIYILLIDVFLMRSKGYIKRGKQMPLELMWLRMMMQRCVKRNHQKLYCLHYLRSVSL